MILWPIYAKIQHVQIFYATKFIRQYRKLPEELKRVVQEKEAIFRINPFDVQLRTHKLSGRLDGFCAFWVKYKFRVIFKFENNEVVRFHEVGNHNIYE